MSRKYTYCARTDTGLVRTNNEDALAFDELSQTAVLADGMGGYNAGEIASAMAVASITTALRQWRSSVPGAIDLMAAQAAMYASVDQANADIYHAANTNPHYAGMGTTLVVGVFTSLHLLLGHIGDSRCYRMRAGALSQITRDHSVLQDQIDAGYLSPEQAQYSDIKNLVTRAVGVEESVELEVNAFTLQGGDLYLMCSDGLSDMVEDARIARIIATAANLEDCAQSLLDAANAAGGKDNVSVLLIAVNDETEKSGLISRLLTQ